MATDRMGLVSLIGSPLRRAAYLLPVAILLTVRALTYASPSPIPTVGWHVRAEQKGRGGLSLTGIPSKRAPGGAQDAVDQGLPPASAGPRLLAPPIGSARLALAGLAQRDGAAAEPQPRAPPRS